MEITGNMINYYYVCNRKLWLFTHNLGFENESSRVQIGKLIDEDSYSKNEKHVIIDYVVNIDMIKDWNILHEIKKSNSIEEAAEWQLKYYIYYLRKKGIDIRKGIIDYPSIKKRIEIIYTDEDENKIEELLQRIRNIVNLKHAPKIIDDKICRSCAYYEYCYI